MQKIITQGVKMKKIAVLIFSIFMLSACQTTPVYNIKSASVPEGLTIKQVEKSIRKALVQKGWTVKEHTSGRIVADILVRSHSAEILIEYSTTNYSINYVDSNDLRYNAKKNTIHKNYNNWIIYVNRLIQVSLIDYTLDD